MALSAAVRTANWQVIFLLFGKRNAFLFVKLSKVR